MSCHGATLGTTYSSLVDTVTLIRLFFERRGRLNACLQGPHQDYRVCTLQERLCWGDAFISRKAKKREPFERWDVFALDLPAAGTQACAHTGLQHRHSGRLSSSSLLSVNLGYHLDRQPFGMKSRISAARCRVAGTRQRPRGTPAAEAPGERELAHTEVYPLPIARNSRCKLNLLGLPLKTQSFLCIS